MNNFPIQGHCDNKFVAVREGNVGTAGAGGFCAFADSENRFSFGYTPNRYTNGYGLGDEPKRLMEAVYAACR